MFLSMVTFYFGLLSSIAFSKTKPASLRIKNVWVEKIEFKCSLGRPKGGSSRLIEVVG